MTHFDLCMIVIALCAVVIAWCAISAELEVQRLLKLIGQLHKDKNRQAETISELYWKVIKNTRKRDEKGRFKK